MVLKDISLEAAEKGKDYSAKLLEKKVGRGQMSQSARDGILARIKPSPSASADFEGCDLIIEAVFEDRDLKAKVTAAAERAALPDAVIASNTSTLPITGLAACGAESGQVYRPAFLQPGGQDAAGGNHQG